jgi:hypothetical protein
MGHAGAEAFFQEETAEAFAAADLGDLRGERKGACGFVRGRERGGVVGHGEGEGCVFGE